jgi:hypothetical protein
VRWALVALACGQVGAALAISGCSSSQEQSAKLERLAKLHARTAPKGLVITRPSREVTVLSSTVVTSAEGTAVVVTLRNHSRRALRAIPLALEVRDAAGASVYTNSAPGLAHALTSVPLIAARGELSWIDDQVQAAGGAPKSVHATAGEAPAATGPLPQIAVSGPHFTEGPEGSAAEGTVTNRSTTAQNELVIFALAERAGRIVAAGRAVLSELAPGASAPFRAFLVGNASGARLRIEAPPSST